MKGRLAWASVWMIVATTVVNLAMVVYHNLMSGGLGMAYADLYALSGVINVLGVITLGLGAWMARTLAVQAQAHGEASATHLLAVWVVQGAPWVLGMALLLLAVAAPLARALRLASVTPVYLVMAGFFFSLLLLSLRSLLQGLHRFGALGSSLALEGIARPALAWLLVGAGYGLSGAVLGSVLALFLALVVGLPGLRRLHHTQEDQAAGPELSREWLGDAVALGLFSLLCYMDAFATKRAYEPGRAAFYARAALVAKSFLFLTSALNMVLLPAVAAARAAGTDARGLFLRFMGLTFLLDLVGLVLLWNLTPLAIRLLCGKDLELLVLAPLIRVFALAVVPLALAQLGLYYHLALGSRRMTWGLLVTVPLYALALFFGAGRERQIVTALGTASVVLLILALWPMAPVARKEAV